jgi:hypothetical protein
MKVMGRWSTWTCRMAASLAACGATLLIVATVAGQEAIPEEIGAIDAPTETVVSAETPFQVTVVVSISHAARSASANFVVPVGKRLVVENLGGRGAATGIQTVILSQSSTVAVLPPKITSASWNWIGTTPTKVIFNAGTVIVAISRATAPGTCTTCTASNYVTITGYLIVG